MRPGYPSGDARRLDSAPMRAATIRDGEVVVDEHPDPEPGAGEVLVRVRAAGLNGADMLQRAGHYPAPPGSPQDIPGLELAGEVAARGPGRRALRRGRPRDGDRRRRRAGRAGHGRTSASSCRSPTALDWAEAGGVPEVFTTAHDALFTQAGLRPGERLLVHGAAGGVGTAAVQLGAHGRRARHRHRAQRRACATASPSSAPHEVSTPRASPSTARSTSSSSSSARPTSPATSRRSPPAGASSSSASAAARRPSSTCAR